MGDEPGRNAVSSCSQERTSPSQQMHMAGRTPSQMSDEGRINLSEAARLAFGLGLGFQSHRANQMTRPPLYEKTRAPYGDCYVVVRDRMSW